MPPKNAEQQQHRRDQSPENKQEKGHPEGKKAEDGSKMEKLKGKVEGMLHKDEDIKNEERQGRKQDPGHQGGQQQQQQQQPMKAAGGGDDKTRTKRGLCWPVENKKDDPARFTRPGSRVSWYYNWSPHPTKGTGGLQFVPMQWNAGGIKELAANVRKSDAQAVLAFNEPELGEQANLGAEDAAQHWLEHIEPLRRRGVRCGSPGISNAGHAVGWMQDFLGRIRRQGSDVDFWCFHWYGPELGPFYDYIWSTHHQLDPKKKVWITEFAATNWDEKHPLPKEHVEKFAQEAFKYLDTLDWVERYCWFAPTRDIGNVGKWARMYNDEGNLTELGKMFRDG